MPPNYYRVVVRGVGKGARKWSAGPGEEASDSGALVRRVSRRWRGRVPRILALLRVHGIETTRDFPASSMRRRTSGAEGWRRDGENEDGG